MPLPFRDRVRRGGLPVLLAPLAVIAAAALVAAASRAHGGFHGGTGPGPTRAFTDQLFTVALVMMVVGIAGVDLHPLRPPRPDRASRREAAAAGTCTSRSRSCSGSPPSRCSRSGSATTAFISRSSTTRWHGPPGAPEARCEARPAAPAHGHLSWVAGIGAIAFLAAAAAALWFSSRTTSQPDKIRLDRAETLSAALDESLAELRAEPDPRRAIIAAYAHMERALAAAGLPRRPAEAPLEYLERALVDLDATAASASRLTDLFRVAKFSDHPLDAQAKEDAIDALEAVRDELRATA